MTAQATSREITFAGLPAIELVLHQGDTLRVALHGAQVLSWVSGGQERLYLSPKSSMNGQAAVRGGVPVCFPQFNQRGPMAERLPKHGFARNLSWQADAPESTVDGAQLCLRLRDNARTREWWPQAFSLQLNIALHPGVLRIQLNVHNTDTQPLAFSGALHTYLAVSDVRRTQLQGLGGQAEWDAVTNIQASAADTLRFADEFDRVYAASAQALLLNDQLHIEQSASWASTVVWNPGQALCQRLADMPVDGWQHMLCIEAAQVFEPIHLPADMRWEGWQQLTVTTP